MAEQLFEKYRIKLPEEIGKHEEAEIHLSGTDEGIKGEGLFNVRVDISREYTPETLAMIDPERKV